MDADEGRDAHLPCGNNSGINWEQMETADHQEPAGAPLAIQRTKLIIRDCLLKRPEEIIGSSHQQRTVFFGIFFILSNLLSHPAVIFSLFPTVLRVNITYDKVPISEKNSATAPVCLMDDALFHNTIWQYLESIPAGADYCMGSAPSLCWSCIPSAFR